MKGIIDDACYKISDLGCNIAPYFGIKRVKISIILFIDFPLAIKYNKYLLKKRKWMKLKLNSCGSKETG